MAGSHSFVDRSAFRISQRNLFFILYFNMGIVYIHLSAEEVAYRMLLVYLWLQFFGKLMAITFILVQGE